MTTAVDDSINVALELFEAAIEKESIGKFSDAVLYYRRAFKLHHTIDKVYRETQFNKEKTAEAEEKLAGEFKGLAIKQTPEESEDLESEEEVDTYSPILELLTDDALVHMLRFLAVVDPPTWMSLSLSCKRLAGLGFDSSVWQNLAINTFSPSKEWLTKHVDEHYMGWKDMYSKRPFIKYNGIYISTCTYLREGSVADSISWSNPIQMITYYRFIRFFKSNRCLRLLTVTEPGEVVPKLTKNWASTGLKGVHEGTWRLNEDSGELSISGEGSVPNYVFIQEFKVASGSRRKHNQLRWVTSSCIDARGEQSEFNLRNERHFVFSRVKSYTNST